LGLAVTEQLKINPARTRYQRGELITGTLEILEAVNAKELTVALEYREATSDYHHAARSVTAGRALHQGPLDAGQSLDFSLQLPADALPNQSGQFGSIQWGLHARIAKSGPDLHTWQAIDVSSG
jgi:hypothetical protein